MNLRLPIAYNLVVEKKVYVVRQTFQEHLLSPALSSTGGGGEGEAACGIHANGSAQPGLARAVPSPREERTGGLGEGRLVRCEQDRWKKDRSYTGGVLKSPPLPALSSTFCGGEGENRRVGIVWTRTMSRYTRLGLFHCFAPSGQIRFYVEFPGRCPGLSCFCAFSAPLKGVLKVHGWGGCSRFTGLDN